MPIKQINRVFLSYAHEDLRIVKKVYDGLKRRKVVVWFDKVDLGPGKWYPQIMREIPRCRYFVIFLSEAALRKTGERPGFQDKELNRAYEIAMAQSDSTFTIVPVRLEDCDRGDVRISTFHQYDLFEEFESGLDRLAIDLEGVSLADKYVEEELTEKEKLILSLFGKGAALFYAGEIEKSLKIYNYLTLIAEGNLEAWFNKGAALSELGRNEEALEASLKAIDINPESSVAWFNKGVVLDKLNRHIEALEANEKSIEISNDFADAWFNKCAILRKLGRSKEALNVFQEATGKTNFSNINKSLKLTERSTNNRRRIAREGFIYTPMVGWHCRRRS